MYVMVDVGFMNGGDLECMFKLIDVVVELGVDVIKFQMVDLDVLFGD